LLTLRDIIDFTANPGAMENHHRAVKPRLGAIAALLDHGGQFGVTEAYPRDIKAQPGAMGAHPGIMEACHRAVEVTES
jgi:hypothetical protein